MAVAAALAADVARAQSLTRDRQERLLADASTAFNRGKELERSDPVGASEAFAEAVSRYEALVHSGVQNGRLFYNLGNAELQRGRLGAAILNYRRAQELIPGDRRLQENLRVARELCRTQIPPRGASEFVRTLFFLHFQTSLRTRFAAGLACYGLFWLVLIVRMYAPRVPLRALAGVLAVAWVGLGTSVLMGWQVEGRREVGVVLAEEVIVRKGNSETYEPKFQQPLYEGTEFAVLESRGDWLLIELADGKTGWIPADRAGMVRIQARVQDAPDAIAPVVSQLHAEDRLEQQGDHDGQHQEPENPPVSAVEPRIAGGIRDGDGLDDGV
jgi:tetratricopeptide (TPR) repeat protein